MNTAESLQNLQNKIDKATLDLISYLTRSVGKVYMIDASKITDGITAEEIIRDLKSRPLTFQPVRTEPEVQVLDFSIDENQCIEIIKNIKKMQEEINNTMSVEISIKEET